MQEYSIEFIGKNNSIHRWRVKRFNTSPNDARIFYQGMNEIKIIFKLDIY